jgi:hypothetical protein
MPGPSLGPLVQFVNSVGVVVNLLVPILIGVALIVFFWGLVKYVAKLGGEEGAKQGKAIMIWGLVALFVMVSVWGIVRMAQVALGVDRTVNVPAPQVPGYQGTQR